MKKDVLTDVLILILFLMLVGIIVVQGYQLDEKFQEKMIVQCPPCEDGEWVAGENPVSSDHGRYDGPVKIDGVPANKAVEQEVSLVDGGAHLATWVWHNGNVVAHFVAIEWDKHPGKALGNYWFVLEVNDSVKLAHRDMGFKILEKYTKFPK